MPSRLPCALVSYTQCAAVITTVGEISVPVHAPTPRGSVISTNASGAESASLTWSVPPTIAPAGAATSAGTASAHSARSRPSGLVRVCRERIAATATYRSSPPRQGSRSSEPRDPLDEEIEERRGVEVDTDLCIRLAARPAPAVDDGSPATQLGLELDLDVALDGRDEPRSDHLGDGHGIVDRRAFPAVRLAVIDGEELDEIGDEDPRDSGRPQVLLQGRRRRD